MMKHFYTSLKLGIIALMLNTLTANAQTKSTFESLLTDPFTYWNGQTATYGSYSNTIHDSIFQFQNTYIRGDYGYGFYDSWGGMIYSRSQDDTTGNYNNDYSAITAEGAFGSENYAVFYVYEPASISLSRSIVLDSVFVTNATYPYITMRDGNQFSDPFGGESGDSADWFMLSIIGINDGVHTDTVEFYLADFRDDNNDNDYIIDEWTKVDLAPLGLVDSLVLSLSSSDMGMFGINTPAYFCLDNLSGATFDELTYTSGDYWSGVDACFGSYSSSFTDGLATFPNYYTVNDYGSGATESWTGFAYSNMEDNTTPGYTNMYSAYPATGVNGSYNYALCNNMFGSDTIFLETATTLSGTFITNGTYGVLSMQNGSMGAKAFGGVSGNDPDWFLLTIRGLNNGIYTDSVEFYLADYRPSNNVEDYIVTDWEFVDFTALGEVDMIEFSLSSSDNGAYGMNTPSYFFIDDFNGESPVNAIENVSVNNTSIYPNPTNGILYIDGITEATYQAELMNGMGQVLIQKEIIGNSVNTINLEEYPTGAYYLLITNDNERIYKQIIKQ